jgi:ATP-dependent helicase IRC3
MILRDYQQAGLQAIDDAYHRGVRSMLLAMATGAGKTVVFADLVSRRPGRALILAHRDRLIQQATEKLEAIIPRHKIGIVKAQMNQCAADVVVASVQTLARSRRLATMPRFDTVIVDECHRSAAVTYRRILDHVRHQDTLLLGVTATPSRADGIGLSEIYEEIVYQIGLLELIEQEYLVPLRGQKIYLNVDFSKLHTRTNTEGINDYKQDEVVELMEQADWYKYATGAWLEHAKDRRTIAFVPPGKDDAGRSTVMAFRLADYMRECGIGAVALNGESPLGEQRRAMADFEAGRVQVIVNCDLMVEGVDLPSANCALWARPTKSEIVYQQGIGRITRRSLATGKVDGLVLDLVGVSNRLDLLTLGDLFGIEDLKDGEDIREAVKREKKAEEAIAEQRELLRVDAEIRAREIDLFGRRQMEQSRQPEKKPFFEWQHYPKLKKSYLKSAKHEFMIAKIGDTYTFADMTWGSNFQGQTRNPREAQRACEQEARRLLSEDKSAPWRSQPASEPQIDLLLKYRINFGPNITKGEASDLLDAKFGKKKQQKEVVTI